MKIKQLFFTYVMEAFDFLLITIQKIAIKIKAQKIAKKKRAQEPFCQIEV